MEKLKEIILPLLRKRTLLCPVFTLGHLPEAVLRELNPRTNAEVEDLFA